jgi:LysM repeat protein
MSAGRKWMVAVVVALVGVLALYYGFFSGPEADPATEGGMLADDPTLASNDEASMENASPRDTSFDRTIAGGSGFLSNSISGAGNNDPAATTQSDMAALGPYGIIGADGKVQPVTIAHDPNDSLIRDLSSSGARPIVTPDPGKGDIVVPQGGAPAIVDPVKTAATPEVKPNTPAATPAAATATVPPKYEAYIVKDNDTMSSIASSWFGDAKKWDLISKANPLVDPTRMQVGQKLNLPPKTAEREKPKLAPGSREYIVRPGDTLVDIARAVYGDGARWKTIYDANKSTIGSDPDSIREGVKLTIPQLASRS